MESKVSVNCCAALSKPNVDNNELAPSLNEDNFLNSSSFLFSAFCLSISELEVFNLAISVFPEANDFASSFVKGTLANIFALATNCNCSISFILASFNSFCFVS